MEFSVFLSEVAAPQETGGQAIPKNSVAGWMIGNLEAHVSTATRRVAGTGLGQWTIGGKYDPATETIGIAIRSSGIDAKVTDSVPGNAKSAASAPPFPMNWKWGVPFPNSERPSTVLDALKLPSPLAIPSKHEFDLLMVGALPQTGLTEFQHLEIRLGDPDQQTVTQTFQDESGLGIRKTTWTFKLTPPFNIERLDRGTDGRNSLISTDTPTFRMVIPGVTAAKSRWTHRASWEVKGQSLGSGTGIPSQLPNSQTFAFKPNPTDRPTGGSTARNRPIQYTISASSEGAVQYFILTQDDTDLLRQEYIDHGESTVPSRSECVAHPIDNTFNVGNYNLVIDGGMQAALDKVALEFGKESKDGTRVLGGFRSPQRNKATGDVHPNNMHVLGRALDLAPDSSGAGSLLAMYQACLRAGYNSFCEAAPGRKVPPGSPDSRHVHIDW